MSRRLSIRPKLTTLVIGFAMTAVLMAGCIYQADDDEQGRMQVFVKGADTDHGLAALELSVASVRLIGSDTEVEATEGDQAEPQGIPSPAGRDRLTRDGPFETPENVNPVERRTSEADHFRPARGDNEPYLLRDPTEGDGAGATEDQAVSAARNASAGGGIFETEVGVDQTVDLVDATDANGSAFLASAEVRSGVYHDIVLEITDLRATGANGSVSLPERYLHVIGAFEVQDGEATQVLIEFDLGALQQGDGEGDVQPVRSVQVAQVSTSVAFDAEGDDGFRARDAQPVGAAVAFSDQSDLASGLDAGVGTDDGQTQTGNQSEQAGFVPVGAPGLGSGPVAVLAPPQSAASAD